MWSFKNASLNVKLTLLTSVAVGMALLVACVAFAVNDIHLIRNSMVGSLTAQADLLGSNATAALAFDDPAAAGDLLRSLRVQKAVEAAAIYDQQGNVFASYVRGAAESAGVPPRPPTAAPSSPLRGSLDIVRAIQQDGQPLGTIYLRANLDQLEAQYLHYVAIAALVMVLVLGASVLLASRLQRAISAPILALANTAQRISRERNYTLRVSRDARDELGTLYGQFNEMLAEIQRRETKLQQAHDELERRVLQRTEQLSQANRELNCEIVERTQAQQQLAQTHQQWMEAARRAGMAEIATGVLHNVGNVLNSINVSATLAADVIRRSRIAHLVRTAEIVSAHADDLKTFVTSDPQGRQLAPFLQLLAGQLQQEHAQVEAELESLSAKVDHVKTIVATQQSYAGVSGVIQSVDVATTLDNAFQLNAATFTRHDIAVVRDYAELPAMALDLQRLLQIVVNLIKNAKDALVAGRKDERRLTLRTRLKNPARLIVEVEDNGEGVAPENLTRIFSHGFTTKQGGHGFGLHSCANAAKEMGGSLTVRSEGRGRGATFVLELPFAPSDATATAAGVA